MAPTRRTQGIAWRISLMRYHGCMKGDFLDEIVDERSRANPRFRELVDAGLRRRWLLKELAARRERRGLTQKVVAERMGTSQSAVARFETGEIDAKFSTVERYAAAIGERLEWDLRPADIEVSSVEPPEDLDAGRSLMTSMERARGSH